MSLQGRIAIVTGASRGIGRGIALVLAKAGADIAVNYRKDEGAAKSTVAEVEALGRKALACQADVTDCDKVKEMVSKVVETLGKPDILVCNAGIDPRLLPIADVDVNEMHHVINTHLFGAFHCIQAVLPYMRQQPRGDIILISSRATLHFVPGSAPYTVAKASLEALAKCLCNEERKNNIRVNVIGPGLVDTDLGNRTAKAILGVDIKEIYAKSPFGRVAQPEDIGNLAAFLCSKEGEYISGQVIYVHGGEVRGPYSLR